MRGTIYEADIDDATMGRLIKTDFVSGSFNDALDGKGGNDEIGAGSGNDDVERGAGFDSEIGEIMIGYHANETLLWIELDNKPSADLFLQLYNLPYDPAHLFNTRDIVF